MNYLEIGARQFSFHERGRVEIPDKVIAGRIGCMAEFVACTAARRCPTGRVPEIRASGNDPARIWVNLVIERSGKRFDSGTAFTRHIFFSGRAESMGGRAFDPIAPIL
ncbi:hypothetical protein [Burkholderia arboris]|uniref:hypothetical protein n=1 Tax=Burkholderia arboris TaxID=488730 RepID=UPI001CF48A2B|nr:hypothetical protein [Burkholderia arboris]